MSTPSNRPRFTAMMAAPVLVASVALMAEGTEATRPVAVESEAVEQIDRYCNASWRNANIPHPEWNDCSQQVWVELLEKVPRHRLPEAIWTRDSEERCELNRAIWRIAQRWVRAFRCISLGSGEAVVESTSPLDSEPCTANRELLQPLGTRHESNVAVAERRWQQLLDEAAGQISDRQREILQLSGDGLPVREIAQQLDITPARVSDEKYRAIKKLRDLAQA
ncbi:MAG: sigma-70 family RNA polymerase sigma factor [Planctomycetales bacterium]|nr:sigma-70 family RNA polymerase sigma factor [Planctomycetales bacterium]